MHNIAISCGNIHYRGACVANLAECLRMQGKQVYVVDSSILRMYVASVLPATSEGTVDCDTLCKFWMSEHLNLMEQLSHTLDQEDLYVIHNGTIFDMCVDSYGVCSFEKLSAETKRAMLSQDNYSKIYDFVFRVDSPMKPVNETTNFNEDYNYIGKVFARHPRYYDFTADMHSASTATALTMASLVLAKPFKYKERLGFAGRVDIEALKHHYDLLKVIRRWFNIGDGKHICETEVYDYTTEARDITYTLYWGPTIDTYIPAEVGLRLCNRRADDVEIEYRFKNEPFADSCTVIEYLGGIAVEANMYVYRTTTNAIHNPIALVGFTADENLTEIPMQPYCLRKNVRGAVYNLCNTETPVQEGTPFGNTNLNFAQSDAKHNCEVQHNDTKEETASVDNLANICGDSNNHVETSNTDETSTFDSVNCTDAAQENVCNEDTDDFVCHHVNECIRAHECKYGRKGTNNVKTTEELSNKTVTSSNNKNVNVANDGRKTNIHVKKVTERVFYGPGGVIRVRVIHN